MPALDGAPFCNHCGASLTAPAGPSGEPIPAALAAPFSGPASPGTSTPGSSSGGMIGRIKNILVSPKTEWAVIASEPSSSSSLYLGYVAPLVAIGVVSTFIGHSMVGLPFVGRVGFGAALAHAVISYGLSFLGVFLIALVADLLAPTFGGQRNALAALKVTVYSFTPGWIAAIFNLIPILAVLGIVGALYGLYLLYLGLPVLMRCPPDKSFGYTVVTVLCAVLTWVLIAVLTTCTVGGLGLAGLSAMGRLGARADPAATADAGAAASSIFGGKSDAGEDRASEALQTPNNRGGEAQNGPSATAHGGPLDGSAATGAVGRSLSGRTDVQAIDFHRLTDMLPGTLPGMQRVEASGRSDEAMAMKSSGARAAYSDGSHAWITIEIADVASLSGLTALATRFDPEVEKETATGYERTRRVDGQLVHERYDRQSRGGELAIVLANRYAVTVPGRGVPREALADALHRIDLTQFASAGR